MDIQRTLNLSNKTENTVLKWSLTRPLRASVVLFVIALFFRWIDGFVLRLDERVGELIFTKSMGFILVVTFLWLAGRKLKDIGFHGRYVRQSLITGVVVTSIAFCVGYAVEITMLSLQGSQPSLSFGAIDSKMGVTGGALFALWMLLCNAINAFMEEGLFRGVIGRLARIRFSFSGANWFQAVLFSIWHLPWVAKYYMVGDITTGGELAMSIVSHSIPMLLVGLVYGYFYLKTGNLWTAWVVHAISNSVLNFVHVSTVDGLDTSIPVRMMVNVVVMFICLLWVKYQAKKYNMAEARPWA